MKENHYSLEVNDFKYIPGKNDAEYIKLLEHTIQRQRGVIAKAVKKANNNQIIKELEFAVEHNKGIKKECYQKALNLVRQKS